MSVDVESDHSLVNVFHVLSTPKTRGMATSDVLIPDTVSYQHGSLKWWYYYDPPKLEKVDGKMQERAGQVMRRDKRDCKPAKIFDSFTRGVRGNVPVATFLYKPGGYLEDVGEDCPTVVEFLDVEGLRDFLLVRDTKPDGILQRFICRGSSNSVTQVIWTPYLTRAVRCQNVHKILNHRLALWDRCVTHEGKSHLVRELICSKQAVDAFSVVCQNIVAHYLAVEHRAVTRLVLFFKFDEIKRMLFLYPSVIITDKVRAHVHRAPAATGKKRTTDDRTDVLDVNKRTLMNLNPSYENARVNVDGPRCEEPMFMTPQGEYLTARDFLDAQKSYSKDPFCPAATKMKRMGALEGIVREQQEQGGGRLCARQASPYPCLVSSKSVLVELAAAGRPQLETPGLDRLRERGRERMTTPQGVAGTLRPPQAQAHGGSSSSSPAHRTQPPTAAAAAAAGATATPGSGSCRDSPPPRTQGAEVILRARSNPADNTTKCSVLKFSRGGGAGVYVLERTQKTKSASPVGGSPGNPRASVQPEAGAGRAAPDRVLEVTFTESGRLQLAAPRRVPRHYLETKDTTTRRRSSARSAVEDKYAVPAAAAAGASDVVAPPDESFYEEYSGLLDGIPLEPSDMLPNTDDASQGDCMAFSAAVLAEELEAYRHWCAAAAAAAPAAATGRPAESRLAKIIRSSALRPASATARASPEGEAVPAPPLSTEADAAFELDLDTSCESAAQQHRPYAAGAPTGAAVSRGAPTAEGVLNRGLWGWFAAAVQHRARAIAAVHKYLTTSLDEVLYKCYSRIRQGAARGSNDDAAYRVMLFPERVVQLLGPRVDAALGTVGFERCAPAALEEMMAHVNPKEWQDEAFVMYRRPRGDARADMMPFSTHRVRQAVAALKNDAVASRDYHFFGLHVFARSAVRDTAVEFASLRQRVPPGAPAHFATATSDVFCGRVNAELLRILLLYLDTRIAAYAVALRGCGRRISAVGIGDDAGDVPGGEMPPRVLLSDLLESRPPPPGAALHTVTAAPDDASDVPVPPFVVALPKFPYLAGASGGNLLDSLGV